MKLLDSMMISDSTFIPVMHVKYVTHVNLKLPTSVHVKTHYDDVQKTLGGKINYLD